MSDLKYWLAFNKIDGVGPVSIMKIWNKFKSIKEAWSTSSAELYEINGMQNHIIEKIVMGKKNIVPEKLEEELSKYNIKAICITDENYPELLKQIYDPPVLLYYRGNLEKCNLNKTIAIVGTRTPTDYGREIAYNLGKDFGQSKVTVVSGLAEGIDTSAHTGCLEANGQTIAVIGSGLNRIYPKSNISLAKQITERDNGAVISEYFPDCPPDSWRFPYRNRIVSGLSYATILVESKEKGGGLITTKHALEQNRDVYGVPSRVDNDSNIGTHNLIHKGEAKIFTGYQEFLQQKGWETEFIKEKPPILTKPIQKPKNVQKTTKGNNYKELKQEKEEKQETKTNQAKLPAQKNINLNQNESIVFENIEIGPTSFDSILKKTCLQASSLLSILTMLELKGLIKQLPGKQYKKCINS